MALTYFALQAVTYFRRALKLSRHYLSAWTLMGHEYVEMKNPPAAIGDLGICILIAADTKTYGNLTHL